MKRFIEFFTYKTFIPYILTYLFIIYNIFVCSYKISHQMSEIIHFVF